MLNNDNRLLYVSDIYIEQIKYALACIYDESLIEYIQLYAFSKTNEEYNFQFINTLTNTFSYMTFTKQTMETVFTDETGYEIII